MTAKTNTTNIWKNEFSLANNNKTNSSTTRSEGSFGSTYNHGSGLIVPIYYIALFLSIKNKEGVYHNLANC